MTGSAVAPAVTTCWAGASSSSSWRMTKPADSSTSSPSLAGAGLVSSSGASSVSASATTASTRRRPRRRGRRPRPARRPRRHVAGRHVGGLARPSWPRRWPSWPRSSSPGAGAAAAAAAASGWWSPPLLVAAPGLVPAPALFLAAAFFVADAVVVRRADVAATARCAVSVSRVTWMPCSSSERSTAFIRLGVISASTRAVLSCWLSTEPREAPTRISSCSAGWLNSAGRALAGRSAAEGVGGT